MNVNYWLMTFLPIDSISDPMLKSLSTLTFSFPVSTSTAVGNAIWKIPKMNIRNTNRISNCSSIF